MKLIDVLLENVDLSSAVPEDTSYKDFATAVAKMLREDYGEHNFGPFMEVLHAELGMNESLTEEMMSGIKKLDFAFIDGTTRLYATYVYLKDGRGNQWDKKLGTQETEELLKSLGINIEFDYYNIGSIIAALKEKGIEATLKLATSPNAKVVVIGGGDEGLPIILGNN